MEWAASSRESILGTLLTADNELGPQGLQSSEYVSQNGKHCFLIGKRLLARFRHGCIYLDRSVKYASSVL